MRRWRVMAALALCVGAPLHAEPVATLAPLLAEFAKVPASSARFDETRRLAGAQAVTKSRGVLRYTAPDRLERETEHPNRERSIVNGHLLTLERTVEGKLVRRSLPLDQLPTLDTFFTALRATLAGNQRALEESFSISLTGDLAAWTMTLKPHAGAGPSGVKQIRFTGESASIRGIEVDEASGDTVRTALTPLVPPVPEPEPEPTPVPGESKPPG